MLVNVLSLSVKQRNKLITVFNCYSDSSNSIHDIFDDH